MPKGNNTITANLCQATFCCIHCNYTAKGERGIRLHQKYKHNIEIFKQSETTVTECCICGKFFKNDTIARKHSLKAHRSLV